MNAAHEALCQCYDRICQSWAATRWVLGYSSAENIRRHRAVLRPVIHYPQLCPAPDICEAGVIVREERIGGQRLILGTCWAFPPN